MKSQKSSEVRLVDQKTIDGLLRDGKVMLAEVIDFNHEIRYSSIGESQDLGSEQLEIEESIKQQAVKHLADYVVEVENRDSCGLVTTVTNRKLALYKSIN